MKSIIIAATTGLLLCTAACSSSSHGTSKPPAARGSGADTTSTAATRTSAETTSAPAHGVDANAWCQELDKAGPAVISAGNPSALPPHWQAKAEALAADAPADIRSDVETVIKTDEQILGGHANADSTPTFLKAGEHLVQWLTSNCPGLMQKYNPGLPTSGNS